MSDQRQYAATVRTVEVLVASALAKQDMKWLHRLAERRFEFRLLAAASKEIPEPPREGWHDLRRLVQVQITSAAGELRASFQAEGYAALVRVAGNAAHLISADGALDVRFRFDAAGSALAVLADTPAVRRALEQFCLTLDEPQNEP